MRGVKLFVIGDSHTNFWNGTGDHETPDQIPGIRTLTIPGATAYSLLSETSFSQARTITLSAVKQAVAHEFDGWLMLNFGANDCNAWIWRQVPRVTLQESVSLVVDRYIRFIHEIRAIYPKVAVFAPPATTKTRDVGTEAERNLAILLFTSMAKTRLSAFDVPVMSMARAMIAPDGSSLPHLYRDDKLHALQMLLPYALHLVNTALGLKLSMMDDPLCMKESRIHDFADVDHCDIFDRHWIRYTLREGAQYISEIAAWPQTFQELGGIDVAITLDSANYKLFPIACPANDAPPAQKCYMPIGHHAREVLFSSHVRKIEDGEIEIYQYGSQISQFYPYSREVLFALHDHIMQAEPVRSICEEVIPQAARVEMLTS